jgi:hypothetical protein
VDWDKGRYDTRSRKVNGRVVREYYSAGEAAELAAQIDALDRADREAERRLSGRRRPNWRRSTPPPATSRPRSTT